MPRAPPAIREEWKLGYVSGQGQGGPFLPGPMDRSQPARDANQEHLTKCLVISPKMSVTFWKERL